MRGEADWVRRRFHEPADHVAVAELGFEVTLAEIYAGVVEITG